MGEVASETGTDTATTGWLERTSLMNNSNTTTCSQYNNQKRRQKLLSRNEGNNDDDDDDSTSIVADSKPSHSPIKHQFTEVASHPFICNCTGKISVATK